MFLCFVYNFAEDGCHTGLCLVGCFLYLLVAYLYYYAFNTKVGDYGNAENFDAAVAGNDNFGYCV